MQLKDKLLEIFDSNNKGYLEDRFVIDDQDFIKYVYIENEPLGYLAVYKKPDFIEREHFSFDIDFTLDDVYLWHLCVAKGAENRGIGSALIKQAIEDTKGDVYSIVNIKNKPSIHMHEKLGFKNILEFEKVHIGNQEQFILYKYSRPKIIKII